jgi:hypothetical protein
LLSFGNKPASTGRTAEETLITLSIFKSAAKNRIDFAILTALLNRLLKNSLEGRFVSGHEFIRADKAFVWADSIRRYNA